MLASCLICVLGFGPRSALGFFLTPLSAANGWGRDVYALAIAMQSLIYGAAQPFAGALADRFGAQRVIIAGSLLYAAGLFLMAHATSPAMLELSAGALIGLGLSGPTTVAIKPTVMPDQRCTWNSERRNRVFRG